MTSPAHAEHGAEELCATGAALYERALREGRVTALEAREVPCPAGLGLLHPSVDDQDAWEPVAPHVGLHRLLRASADRIADERRREERLAGVFAPLLADGPDDARTAPALTLHTTRERIGQAIDEAMTDASELLAIQPRSTYVRAAPVSDEPAIRRDQALLSRGGRIRVLYQHTLRHAPGVAARYERLHGDVEARGLDEVTDRLIVVDRAVAFVPANADRATALEMRHPAIVGYLATTFDRLWRLATPMYPETAPQPSVDGITPRQRAIAELLVEGHTDAVVADRLGMNIRTARVHIARLATLLGSRSRAQLGYLIGRSGILDRAR